MHHLKLRKFATQPLGEPRRYLPQFEAVMEGNEELHKDSFEFQVLSFKSKDGTSRECHVISANSKPGSWKLFSCLREHPQIMPRHLFRLRDAEHAQHGRRNVLQRAVRTKREAARVSPEVGRCDRMLRCDDEWHWVGRMRGLRAAGCRIDHLFCVAVVGGDNHRTAMSPQGGVNLAQA